MRGIFIYRDTVYCELQYKTYVACGEHCVGILDWYTVNIFYSITRRLTSYIGAQRAREGLVICRAHLVHINLV